MDFMPSYVAPYSRMISYGSSPSSHFSAIIWRRACCLDAAVRSRRSGMGQVSMVGIVSVLSSFVLLTGFIVALC